MATTNLGTVAIHGEGDWNSSAAYTKLSVVAHNGGSYMAVQAVPAGTALTDASYWMPISDTRETFLQALEQHPEWVTTVEDGSVSADKLTPELAAEVNRIGVVDERVDDVEDEVYSQQADVAALDSRMAAIEAGTTPEGSEIIGVRTSADAVLYPTAGDAVREQVRRIVSATPWELPIAHTNWTYNGVTYTWDNDVCNVVGTATGTSFDNLISDEAKLPIGVRPGEKIYLRISTSSPDIKIRIFFNKGESPTPSSYCTEDSIVDIPADCHHIIVRINVASGVTVDGTIKCAVYSGVPYSKAIDTTLSVPGLSADAATTGTAIGAAKEYAKNLVDGAVDVAISLHPIEMCAYTNFQNLDFWWNSDGSLGTNASIKHSQMLRIMPDTTYYVGYTNETSPVRGAFFDAHGNWIAPLLNWMSDERPGDLVKVEYDTPTYNRSKTDYVDIYSFTSPENAYYISLNLMSSYPRVYREYLCSKPAFLYSGGDNIAVGKDDPAYSRTSKRKLLLIGPSTLMIDRWLRTEISGQAKRYISGFQEYLVPWFDKVDSCGISGGSWKPTDPDGVSILEGVAICETQHGLNLADYDDYIIVSSTNNITAGTIGTWDAVPDIDNPEETYMGGLVTMVAKIYRANPYAKIYLTNHHHKSNYYTSETYKANIDASNEQIRLFAAYQSLELIDVSANTGFNSYTKEILTYDGVHYNSIGCRAIGEYIRRQIVGV